MISPRQASFAGMKTLQMEKYNSRTCESFLSKRDATTWKSMCDVCYLFYLQRLADCVRMRRKSKIQLYYPNFRRALQFFGEAEISVLTL